MVDKNFEIGQVVYILSEQAQTILPGMVVEECVVKKLSGNSISWKVKVGAGDKAKLFDSSKIKGEIYGTLEEVHVVMTERLTKFVENLMESATKRVENWYGKEVAEQGRKVVAQPQLSQQDLDDKIDPDILLSSIENSMPEPKFTKEATIAAMPQTNLRSRLRDLATPDDEDQTPLEGEGTVFMVDAGGNRVPVRMPKQ